MFEKRLHLTVSSGFIDDSKLSNFFFPYHSGGHRRRNLVERKKREKNRINVENGIKFGFLARGSVVG
jgi:hypothetical protein